MIELKTINYLTIQECEELIRVNSIDDFHFTEMVENDSFVCFDCSEDNIQELEESGDFDFPEIMTARPSIVENLTTGEVEYEEDI